MQIPYLTFEQAMSLIKKDTSKNPHYVSMRINYLINKGYLKEVIPKVYLKIDNNYIESKIKIERFVSLDSVQEFLKRKPYHGKRILIKYVEGEKVEFESIQKAIDFLQISRGMLAIALKKNKYFEISGRLIKFKQYENY